MAPRDSALRDLARLLAEIYVESLIESAGDDAAHESAPFAGGRLPTGHDVEQIELERVLGQTTCTRRSSKRFAPGS